MLNAMSGPPSSVHWRFPAQGVRENAKVRVGRLAAGQFGRVRVDQLRALGVAATTIRHWRDDGYLHPELPRVYAVGHPGRSTESDLCAAVLYAGPDAMLSHATAAWWLGLLKYPFKDIVVSTPRRIRSRQGIRVHGRRRLSRIWHRGLPVTDAAQTIIDFAAAAPTRLLRLALANADFHDCLDLARLEGLMGRGTAGSGPLRAALTIHMPELAHIRGRTEILLLELCERHRLPIPQVNVYLEGWMVDAYWSERRLVVEIDDTRGHRSPAQLQRDHQRDLELRAAGYVVLRYTERQLIEIPAAVAAEIQSYL